MPRFFLEDRNTNMKDMPENKKAGVVPLTVFERTNEVMYINNSHTLKYSAKLNLTLMS